MPQQTASDLLMCLFAKRNFKPNDDQLKAILHTTGPLFLVAGPGSGKTRVLLWRTVNLIVCQNVPPLRIFLATFTEKAAKQLRDGLITLLALASMETGKNYDLSEMYIGTVHSLCLRLLEERKRLYGDEGVNPRLIDELDQHFFVQKGSFWSGIVKMLQTSSVGMVMQRDAFQISDRKKNDLTHTHRDKLDKISNNIRLDEEERSQRYIEQTEKYEQDINRWSDWLSDIASINDENILGLVRWINTTLGNNLDQHSKSRFKATKLLISWFNRLSEEGELADALVERAINLDDAQLFVLVHLYSYYREQLQLSGFVDFSLLQYASYQRILHAKTEDMCALFDYVIVDEYQDTNAIQEKLYTHLAQHGNWCVVGDDDQALYRFRGATVENFVQFAERVQRNLGIPTTRIDLVINYRSRHHIVEMYRTWMETFSWGDSSGRNFRLNKNIRANKIGGNDSKSAVVRVIGKDNFQRYTELAETLKKWHGEGNIRDWSDVAFLYPSLKSTAAQEMMDVLNGHGIPIYAPRAKKALEGEEVMLVIGLLRSMLASADLRTNGEGSYSTWLRACEEVAETEMKRSAGLRATINEHSKKIHLVISEAKKMRNVADTLRLSDQDSCNQDLFDKWRNELLSDARNQLSKLRMNVKRRSQTLNVGQAIRYVTALPLDVLDYFYRWSAFSSLADSFNKIDLFNDLEVGTRLSQLSQWLSRSLDFGGSHLNGGALDNGSFDSRFFGVFWQTIWQREEAEEEQDGDTIVPKGLIPFLTIHQSKGLEFPIVVLGTLRKDDRGARSEEHLMRRLIPNIDGEPLDCISQFDNRRQLYVALSRPKQLLILVQQSGQGNRVHDSFESLLDKMSSIQEYVPSLLEYEQADPPLPQTYSYTTDYIIYDRCPRYYRYFKQLGFTASTENELSYGALVHETLEELHRELTRKRNSGDEG